MKIKNILKINVKKNHKLPKFKNAFTYSLHDQLLEERLSKDLRVPF